MKFPFITLSAPRWLRLSTMQLLAVLMLASCGGNSYEPPVAGTEPAFNSA